MNASVPADPQSPQARPAPKHEIKHEIIELIKMVVLFLIIFCLLKAFVVEGYEVQGSSMEPTLHEGERILVLKLPFELSQYSLFSGFEAIKRDDILVFESEDENGRRYIKRVIAHGPNVDPSVASADGGEAGPKVEFDQGAVYIDDQKIEEPYLPEAARVSAERRNPVTVTPGQFYVLGDNRDVSKDSRSFGPIDRHQVIGRAALRFWPLNKFGFL